MTTYELDVPRRCDCPESEDGRVKHHRKCVRNIASGESLEDQLGRLERTDPKVGAASRALDRVYRNVGGGLPSEQIRDIYNLERTEGLES